jgi:hypothetical protein
MVFWLPLILFGVWIAVMCNLLLRALKRQREEAQLEGAQQGVAVAV